MAHSPGFLKLVNDARKLVKETTVAEVLKRLQNGETLSLIDVREDREWEQGHLPGAVHMARGVIERDIEQAIPDKSKELILYCGGGFRSVLSAESLQKMGYLKVISMDGGWRGWNEAKGPVEK
jgi:rhodanese-related sulfurtransferase